MFKILNNSSRRKSIWTTSSRRTFPLHSSKASSNNNPNHNHSISKRMVEGHRIPPLSPITNNLHNLVPVRNKQKTIQVYPRIYSLSRTSSSRLSRCSYSARLSNKCRHRGKLILARAKASKNNSVNWLSYNNNRKWLCRRDSRLIRWVN